MNPNKPEPSPEGWERIKEGLVKIGDKFWNPETVAYENARSQHEVGLRVGNWPAVLRKKIK